MEGGRGRGDQMDGRMVVKRERGTRDGGWREGEREPGEGRRGRGHQMDGRMEVRRERAGEGRRGRGDQMDTRMEVRGREGLWMSFC